MSIYKKQKELRLKRGQLYWLILEAIGLSLVAGGGSPLRPTLPILVKTLVRIIKELKKITIEEEKVKESLKKLEKRELIDLVEKDEKIYVYLKDKNNQQILKYSIKSILDFKKKKKEWRKKWFLVFFDVPEIQRNKRNYLRRFLGQLGFYRYQKSVYIFPYDCEKEIALIKKIVEGAKYMKYIVAEKIEDEEELKRFFRLT